MPFRRLPNTDDSRLSALQTAKLKKDSTPPADWPISATNAAKLDTLYPQFKTALGTRAAQSEESTAARATGTAFNLARQLISHFLQALNNAIDRNAIPAAARAYYQLDVSQGTLPNISSQADVLLWGDRLADGEAKRITAGGAPIPFPTIGEVTAAVTDFTTKYETESTKAGTLTTDEQAVAALRPAADALILDLWDEIAFAYRHDPPATARDKARLWGVVYDTRPGEPPDNPPTPPAPAANAAEPRMQTTVTGDRRLVTGEGTYRPRKAESARLAKQTQPTLSFRQPICGLPPRAIRAPSSTSNQTKEFVFYR